MCFGTDAVLCCWESREEVRERGNCHIKGKEFKINLISQSLSPPHPHPQGGFTVSMLRLVVRHRESTEGVKWRRGKKEGEVLIEVTDWLLTRMNLRGKVHTEGAISVCKSCVATSELVVLCLCMCLSTTDICIYSYSAPTFPTMPHFVAE